MGGGRCIRSILVLCFLLLYRVDLFSLKNIVFNAYPGDLICVIGPVGSGKVFDLF